MELLKTLCQILAPSGNEGVLTNFLLEYIKKEKANWKTTPELFFGEDFQECIVLVFGKPRTAIFAHLDSIGFTVRYENEIVKIGKPVVEKGIKLKGKDSLGDISCEIDIENSYEKPENFSNIKWWLKRLKGTLSKTSKVFVKYPREIERGTELVFDSPFRETEEFIESCYLDDRLGVWNALQVAKNLEDGIICFSCNEEHSGGTVPFLAKFIYEKYGVKQALISDVSWITKGVVHGKGAVISFRDKDIPRQSFIRKITNIIQQANIPFQIEVEDAGSSDGRELQISPYPFDWCFIGAPEDNVHSPNEKVHKKDIESMLNIYKHLMNVL
jgi:putative aminopeptidase FrvX